MSPPKYTSNAAFYCFLQTGTSVATVRFFTQPQAPLCINKPARSVVCNDACCGVYSSESLRDFSFLIISLPSRLLRTQFTFFQKHLITFSQLQPKKIHRRDTCIWQCYISLGPFLQREIHASALFNT